MQDPNTYIIAQDQEWVKRWEKREAEFRKLVESSREEYDRRMTSMTERVNNMSLAMHKQQEVILKIRDDIPFIGKYLVRWAGYNEGN